MRPVSTDVERSVVCVSVCVLGTWMHSEKTAEPMEMPFGNGEGADTCGTKEPYIRWGPDLPTGRGTFEKDVPAYCNAPTHK